MRVYNVGFIGFGYWGRILYRYFHRHEGFRVRQIAARHPEKIEGEFGGDVILSTPEQLLDNEEIDAVITATPIGTHFPNIMKALERGKHVFSEKPLTLSFDDGMKIKRLADEKGLKVFTDYIFRFSPAVNKMLEMVNEGEIGRVKGMIFLVRQLGHFANDVYLDLGCHILSIIDGIKSLENFNFTKRDIYVREGVVETGRIDFEENGGTISGSIILSFNHPLKDRSMTVYGEKGTLIYDMTREKPLTLARYKVDRNESRDPIEKRVSNFEFDEFNTLKEVVDGFYNTLEGRIEPNIDLALRVTKVLEELGAPPCRSRLHLRKTL